MLKDVKKSMTSFERRIRLQEVLARVKLDHLLKIPLIAMFA
jgi:phage baseplate assembly protein W